MSTSSARLLVAPWAAVHCPAQSATIPASSRIGSLSICRSGTNTGEGLANENLRNINIQFTVRDLLNKHSPFAYVIIPCELDEIPSIQRDQGEGNYLQRRGVMRHRGRRRHPPLRSVTENYR